MSMIHQHFVQVVLAGTVSVSGELVDMCWNDRDAWHIWSVHTNGIIVLWDMKRKEKFSNNDEVVLPK